MLHVACLSSALLLRLSLGNCCVQLFVEFYAYKVVFSTIFFYHFPSPPPSSLSICDWFHSSLSLSLFVCLGHFRVSWTAVMRFLKQFKAIPLSLPLSHFSLTSLALSPFICRRCRLQFLLIFQASCLTCCCCCCRLPRFSL